MSLLISQAQILFRGLLELKIQTSKRIQQAFGYFDPTHVANHFNDGKNWQEKSRSVMVEWCFSIRNICHIWKVFFVQCIVRWNKKLFAEQT